MKRVIPFLMAGIVSVTASAQDPAPAPDVAALEQQAQTITQQFGGQLKALLQANLMSGGPVQAMQVCKVNAPEIAQGVSQQQGWDVGRTSTKVRNPENKPDAWEARVLADWADKIQRGAPVAGLKASEMVEQNGVRTYRYMAAIPTGEVCLNCHGTQLSGQVKETLKALYPQDQATGFKLGELRGAFTLQKSL